jgi:drug/metabolite transporter (DMT)-like permease
MQTAMPKNYTSLYVVFAASLWGLDAIVLRPALYAYPVSLVVFIETGIVALLLSPFFAPRLAGLRHLDTHTWLAFLAVAVFGGAIGTLAITKALFFVDYINLSIVVLMQKLQPIFAIVLAWLFLGERPGKNIFFLECSGNWRGLCDDLWACSARSATGICAAPGRGICPVSGGLLCRIDSIQ